MQRILGLSEWESRAADLYSSVRSFRCTQTELLELRQKRIYDELNRKHGGKRAVYSTYVKGYVAGLLRAHDAQLMQSDVEFCYLENGVLFSTHRVSTHRTTEEFYSTGRGCDLGKLPSGFYWKGTDRPFYSSQGIAQ